MGEEKCPKCGALFAADSAWANRSISGWLVFGIWQNLDTRVKCPKCRHMFQAQEFRHLGYVAPRAVRLGIAIFLVAILMVAVVAAIMSGT